MGNNLLSDVKKQYDLYLKAIEPYRITLKSYGIVNQKENEIFKKLLVEYLDKYNMRYTNKDPYYYVTLDDMTLEVFITNATMHVATATNHKKYYLDVSLEIQNIYSQYDIVYIESADQFAIKIESMYEKAERGKLSDDEMMQFLDIMQKNLLKLNQEKHYLATHSLPTDYEYTLTDTVYTDDTGEYFKYSNFGIAWQMMKNRIADNQYH